ncbi:hypothetical protein [Sebaldella sp. S0638]|uniref:hypothetical protein n=1 Tax=Sebaldella sp. S0638 TaxID=2957809 RepID=UPI00209F0002|nr:hypothetical protein [Sebaldella sp. S0638]MCP1224385.1 hypothetical protein [Sebaldella sp. S0638]
MRRFFLFILPVLLVITACKAPEEIILPEKHLSVQDRIIVYRKEPYTGKLVLPKSQKGNEGYMYVKDGHLDGNAEIRNVKDGFLLKYNISGGKFQGELLYKSGDGELVLNVDNGTILSMQMKNDKEKTDYDFTFTNGLANGTFKYENKKIMTIIAFKDGMAKIENDSNMDIEAKFSIDQNTWMITMESFVDGKSYSKTEKFLGINLETIEDIVFSSIEDHKAQK